MTIIILIPRTNVDYLPAHDGLLFGNWCQQRGIHFLANFTKSAGPVISFSGGRFPFSTCTIIRVWSTSKHPSDANYMQPYMQQKRKSNAFAICNNSLIFC